MKRITNRDLGLLFRTINERFFDDRLDKKTKVRFASEEDDDFDETDGMYLIADKTILIDRSLGAHADLATITLIHEMIHADMPDHISYPMDQAHGMLFQHRIVDLFNRGAYDGLL